MPRPCRPSVRARAFASVRPCLRRCLRRLAFSGGKSRHIRARVDAVRAHCLVRRDDEYDGDDALERHRRGDADRLIDYDDDATKREEESMERLTMRIE